MQGGGPTMLISPRTMLMIWGSSSRPAARIQLPPGISRSSLPESSLVIGTDDWIKSFTCIRCVSVCAFGFIVRNLKQMKMRMHRPTRSEEHTSELQSLTNLVCRLLLEKKNKEYGNIIDVHT